MFFLDNPEVVLINPPDFDFGRLKKIRQASPPLGLLYLATFLNAKGIKTEIIDGMVEPEKLSPEVLAKRAYKVVGLTAATPMVGMALKLARMIKAVLPDCIIVIGGAHPSVCPEEVIKHDAVDYVMVGEGEYAFQKFCDSILNHTQVDHNGGILTTATASPSNNDGYIEELDSLPVPDMGLIPFAKYKLSPQNYMRKPSTPIITSRGCPFRCTYCSNPVHGKKVRYNSPEYVIEYIRYLFRDYSVKDICFWDDTFTLHEDRVATICEQIIGHNISITWSCASRVDRVSEELLRLMKRSGCWCISFGVETGSERLLKSIGKNINKSQIRTAFNLCAKIGIQTRGFFILGLPTETGEESEATIRFAKELQPDFAQFTLAVPYPGSPMFDEAMSEGWEAPDWDKFTTYPEDEPVYVTRGRTPQELMALQARAFKGFYFRPHYILKRMKQLRSWEELVKNAKVAINLLGF